MTRFGGTTTTEALNIAVLALARCRGTRAEPAARIYVAVQTFIADVAWRTRRGAR